MKIIEGQRDPARLAAQRRQAAIASVRGKHKGKAVAGMGLRDLAEVVQAMAQQAGLADEGGVLL